MLRIERIVSNPPSCRSRMGREKPEQDNSLCCLSFLDYEEGKRRVSEKRKNVEKYLRRPTVVDESTDCEDTHSSESGEHG